MAYRKKVFISYHFIDDKQYKNLLLAWSASRNFDFSFNDNSADFSIHSEEASVIKSVISRKIKTATYLLVIVGPNTHKSEWVNWEIEKAVELKKKIIAVKTHRQHTSPRPLLGAGAKWALSFKYAAIIKAINNC